MNIEQHKVTENNKDKMFTKILMNLLFADNVDYIKYQKRLTMIFNNSQVSYFFSEGVESILEKAIIRDLSKDSYKVDKIVLIRLLRKESYKNY